MAHDHQHAEPNTYYLEQLCSIGFCGALGIVQILLYYGGQLKQILDPKFHIPVLVSGITLAGLAALRGISLWVAVGKLKGTHPPHAHDCGHDHSHEHAPADSGHNHSHEHEHEHQHAHADCGHDHSHEHEHEHQHAHADCGHDHSHEHEHEHQHAHADCGHDHGWAPWRYVVLLLPLILYLLGMPTQAAPVEEEPLPDNVRMGTFKGIYDAVQDADSQSHWEDGHLYRVRAMYSPGRQGFDFRIFRLKMTCCAADGYPVYIFVKLSPKSEGAASQAAQLPEFQMAQWVNVTGKVHFQRAPGRNETVAILEMNSVEDVKPTSPDNPFLPN